jgi:diaminohydroxyphosphoribosylaminopyrimidine deaminase/5-amino-6-(5-phosphoribosylamino)uracil reductase
LPLVRFKWAMTLDGRIATAAGHSRWISSRESRAQAHLLRQQAGAILVGAGTVLSDDPVLTVRDLPPTPPDAEPARFPQPVRIALDPHRKIGAACALARSARDVPFVLWRYAPTSKPEEATDLDISDVGGDVRHWTATTEGRESETVAVLRDIVARGVDEVLIEGGASVFGGALASHADLYDAFVAPVIVGETAAPGPVATNGLALVAMPPGFTDEAPLVRTAGRDAWLTWTRRRDWWDKFGGLRA